MAKKPSRPTGPLSGIAADMLVALKQEFVESGRSSTDLQNGYVGPKLTEFQTRFLESGAISRVDYDLALKELEDRALVETGPSEMYDNDPSSGVIIFAMFSKREFIYLKEDGYKMAKDKPVAQPQALKQNVHISGNFYNSPVGVGGEVSQNINFDVSNEADSAKYLAELLVKSGQPVTDATKADLDSMVQAANAGNMAVAKPIFQRVFGVVTEPIKQLAYGVLTAIITKQMGM